MMLKQSRGRNVRIGMKGPIHHFYITTRDALHFDIWKRVHQKENNQEMIQMLSFNQQLQQFIDD